MAGRSLHRPIAPPYYIEDCRILCFIKRDTAMHCRSLLEEWHKNQMKLQSIGKARKPQTFGNKNIFWPSGQNKVKYLKVSLHCDAFRSQRPSSWKSMILNRKRCHAPCNDQLIIPYQIVETNKVDTSRFLYFLLWKNYEQINRILHT